MGNNLIFFSIYVEFLVIIIISQSYVYHSISNKRIICFISTIQHSYLLLNFKKKDHSLKKIQIFSKIQIFYLFFNQLFDIYIH